MPISRKDFEEGVDETSKKVISFLKIRRNEAFTSREIADGVGMLVDDVIDMLNYLCREGRYVEREVIAGTHYYAYSEEK